MTLRTSLLSVFQTSTVSLGTGSCTARSRLPSRVSRLKDRGKGVQRWFAVDNLDVERLLADWRWLCPGRMRLAARNVFGDLFLADESGSLFRLDVAVGKLTRV